ncbi:hypothetical protein VNO78_31366 [Psophocarpus tetragonolobus]|uniref:Uncharacterized protein n=1 Tax=Psophocarpus tetragonolobus TaxID=3891 RepID=A0AAN9RY78_PSOTE
MTMFTWCNLYNLACWLYYTYADAIVKCFPILLRSCDGESFLKGSSEIENLLTFWYVVNCNPPVWSDVNGCATFFF